MLKLTLLVAFAAASCSGFQLKRQFISEMKGNNIKSKAKFYTLKPNTPLYATSPENSITQQNQKSPLPPWFFSFGTACLGGLLFGLDIGSSSSVIRILGTGTSVFGNLDAIQLGQIASGSLFGAIISSALITLIGDKEIGRKNELQIASLAFITGSLVQSLSTSFPVALLGRILYGLGIGTAMHVAPLYIAETAPNELRGRLVSFKEAAIVLGIVFGYGAGAVFGADGNWQGVFQTALPFEVLMMAGAFAVAESPRWLALRGRREEAVEALQQVQVLETKEAEKEVQAMIKIAESSVALSTDTVTKFKEIFADKYNRRALVIGVGLVLFQQLSGQPSVLYYANRIFEQAGFGFEAALGVGVFKLLLTFLSSALVENPNFGRRTLLLYGNAGVTASLLLLSFFYGQQADPANIAAAGLSSQAAIIASILFFVGSYQVGFGPITWLVLSEVFPLRVRSAAVSLGTLANFCAKLLVTLVFEAERQQLGESLLFLQFGGIAFLATVFTYFFVFETRGLSLEAIEQKLRDEVDDDN